MKPKTKNNMNFQPEWTITDQSTLIITCGGLIERGAYLFSSCEKGGLSERGSSIEDLRYVSTHL